MLNPSVYRAFRGCLCGDDGALHQNGKVVVDFLRDVCHFGDSPLDKEHYSGDAVMLGRFIGRQEVFLQVLEQLHFDADEARIEQIERYATQQRDLTQESYDG